MPKIVGASGTPRPPLVLNYQCYKPGMALTGTSIFGSSVNFNTQGESDYGHQIATDTTIFDFLPYLQTIKTQWPAVYVAVP